MTEGRLNDGSFGNGSHEETLEDLVWKYVEAFKDGQPLDKDAILHAHPSLGRDLIQHLEAFHEIGGEESDDVPLGTLGDYTLRRQIGRGGMGVVYEAWQQSMDRIVALKVLPPGIAADNRSFTRFLREAKTAGQLSHQNIVGVHSTGVEEGTPWYSMEYVEGETLAQILTRIKDAEPDSETPFGPKDQGDYFIRLARAFADVADGLQHAHSKGVTHRDIKPSNLILDGDGRLRILDFGLARLEGQESLTLSGDFVGTPLYTSPEQARRKKIPVDHRTDIYSLGATLYETLCGCPPFRGRNHADTLSQIIERDPVEPRKLNPRTPKDLETIVLKCLRKEPGDRYGTAEALGQDLRRFVRGDAIEARPEGRWIQAGREFRRQRSRLAWLSVVLLLVVVVALWFTRERELSLADRETEYANALRSAIVELELVRPVSSVAAGRVPERERVGRVLFGPANELDAGLMYVQAALERLRAATDVFPDRPSARYHAARALAALGRLDESLVELVELTNRSPDFVPGWTLLAIVHELRGDEAGANESLIDARAAATRPRDEAWIAANLAFAHGEWATAEKEFSRLRDLELADDGAHFGAEFEVSVGRGVSRLEQKDFEAAQRDLVETLVSWPGAVEPGLLLGQVYLLEGKLAAADAWFRELHKSVPGDSRERVARATAAIYFEREFDEVVPKALEWIERLEESPVRQRARAFVEAYTYDLADAIDSARAAVREDPSDPLNAAVVGFALSPAYGHDEEARRWLEQAARDGHDRAEVCLIAALGFIQLGEYERSRALDARAVEIDPDFRWAEAHLGRDLIRTGKLDEARTLLERLLSQDDSEIYTRVWLAEVLEEQGELESAEERLREALERDPTGGLTLSSLARFLERRGRDAEAEILYRRLWERSASVVPVGWWALPRFLSRTERPDEALRLLAKKLPTLPASVYSKFSGSACVALSELLRGGPRPPDLEPLETLVPWAHRIAADTGAAPWALEAAALVLTFSPTHHDPDEAEECARGAVERDGGRATEYYLATLATVLIETGKLAEARRVFERVVTHEKLAGEASRLRLRLEADHSASDSAEPTSSARPPPLFGGTRAGGSDPPAQPDTPESRVAPQRSGSS